MTTEQSGGTAAVPEFHLGDRMEKALEHAGLSHSDMADYLGVTRNTIGNYVHMRRRVATGILRIWALRTGVSFDWLQTGAANPRSPDGTPVESRSAAASELDLLTNRKRARRRTARGVSTERYDAA